MPNHLETTERKELQSTTDRPVTVKALCGELQATLVADGSFTLEYDNVLHVDLNSFELLWYVKQQAFLQKAQGVVRLLQPTIACDPSSTPMPPHWMTDDTLLVVRPSSFVARLRHTGFCRTR